MTQSISQFNNILKGLLQKMRVFVVTKMSVISFYLLNPCNAGLSFHELDEYEKSLMHWRGRDIDKIEIKAKEGKHLFDGPKKILRNKRKPTLKLNDIKMTHLDEKYLEL